MVAKLEDLVLSNATNKGASTQMDPMLITSRKLRTQNGFTYGDGTGMSTMENILSDMVEFQLRKLVTKDALSNNKNDGDENGVISPLLMNQLLTPISKLLHST
eukprot:CAMPEP_0171326846 /NCGR_PEP_ID=MMETSP0816-20121228/117706_1 /TAXON_ID=420281 /ORGANISM="Proboscia inermis, Strain CCAP1064/1" /LENGTH=102 /DNA_ID=CAMNT_0011826411 /DNA_START=922 /DNA_END=1230 /DNA_ORIENTATION=-